MPNALTLHANWLIKTPLTEVFNIITDFEKWPQYFPKVASSIQVVKRDGNNLELAATVKSFGRSFPVQMHTQILPGKGFVSDNQSPKFGTSGHEELLLKETKAGTLIDYTYQVTIHKRWLRIIARPLISWFSMKYWQKAVIDELRKICVSDRPELDELVMEEQSTADEMWEYLKERDKNSHQNHHS